MSPLSLVAMTSAEKEVVLNLNHNTVTKFTKTNLATYDRLRVKESYPRIFGTHAPSYIKYVGPKLVNISDIELDNIFFEQTARKTVNLKMPELREDIRLNGFNLAELGIFLVRQKNGKYLPMEGRTRTKLIREFGMTNVIADIFDVDKLADIVRFAIFMNSSKKPYGEASYEDIHNAIMYLINSGNIAKQPDTDSGRNTIRRLIGEELDFMSGGKLKPSQYDLIIHAAVDKALGYSSVRSFPQGKGAQKCLEDNLLGAERVARDLTNGIKYVAVATLHEKMFKRMITETARASNFIKEIRFVVHIGVPKASDPEGNWISSAANFKKDFNTFEEQIAEIRFNNTNVDSSRIKIWGAIPQVRSLDKKYPMNRVYVYK